MAKELDYTDLISDGYADNNKIWLDFADIVTTIHKDEILYYINLLTQLRDPRIQGLDILQKNVEMLGFSFKASFIDEENLKRLHKFLGIYYEQKGNISFIEFMGFIKNTRFRIDQLWSKRNESDFYDKLIPELYIQLESDTSKITEDIENGLWFPTSHVTLSYDGLNFPIEDESDIQQLFYQSAPIHLVMDALYAHYDFSTELYMFPIGIINQEIYTDASKPFGYDGTLYINAFTIENSVTNIKPNDIYYETTLIFRSLGHDTEVFNSYGSYSL